MFPSSEKLVAAIRTALGTRYGISLEPMVNSGDKKWDRVVDLACRIPQAFFPKEVRKHAATFRCDDGGQTLTAKFPVDVKLTFPSEIKVTCSTVVDAHSTTFKVPFP